MNIRMQNGLLRRKKTDIQTMQERYGGIKEHSMDKAWGKFGMDGFSQDQKMNIVR